MDGHIKHWIDLASVSTAVATLFGWMPSIAATLSVVWGILRIYESQTVQGWLQRRSTQIEIDKVLSDGD